MWVGINFVSLVKAGQLILTLLRHLQNSTTKSPMKTELEKLTGMKLPDDFIRILTAFSDKFGGLENGIDEFLNYLNSSEIVHIEEGRGYEETPVEISPFIATGGDGIHNGYLILAPELELHDFPVVGYTPGSGHIDFCGNTTTEGIEQLISYGHADDDFEEIDLSFLNSINIYPSSSKSDNGFYGINYDPSDLITPPLKMPDNYSFMMTHDGVGVLARADIFNKNHKQLKDNNSSKEFIEEAKSNMDKGYWASALFHLKEAWFYKFYEETDETKRLLRDLQIKVYKALGRDVYATRLSEEYNWL